MKDSWQSGNKYEYFMGRWSRLVAHEFVNWLSPSPGLKWLDIGCGSGALSEAIITNCNPAKLTALDQSAGFMEEIKKRLGEKAQYKVGDATALPMPDASVNCTVSGLVLNFIPDQLKALSEMKRVTTPNGMVAAYVWDYAGKMEVLRYFWDAVIKLELPAAYLHESYRFQYATLDAMKEQFVQAGYQHIEATTIEIKMTFTNFDDYWNPFLGGQGPAPTFLLSLDENTRQKVRTTLFESLPIQSDGTIPLVARALAVKGKLI